MPSRNGLKRWQVDAALAAEEVVALMLVPELGGEGLGGDGDLLGAVGVDVELVLHCGAANDFGVLFLNETDKEEQRPGNRQR